MALFSAPFIPYLLGYEKSFKIGLGNLLLERLEASLELGFGHG
jgi:hypothetical protein